MPDLLLEVGLEEIPARMIKRAEGELLGLVEGVLQNIGIAQDANANRRYSSPRRLGVLLPGVPAEQNGSEETLIGPSLQIAYKGGQPSPAAHAFARKAGVELSELTRVTTTKGEYIAATIRHMGRPTAELLAEQIPSALARLYWPKSMYWRAGKPERFVRPLRWILALLDDQVLPLEFAGISASNKTYGHRILYGDQPVEINQPASYLKLLEAAYVIADVGVRRQRIHKALDAATRSVPGLRWREDRALVDTVTHLTEWPSVVLGSFEGAYLSLPEEVLVTVMRDHQKYFAVEDEFEKLAPYFLAVLNTEADAAGLAVIRHGNERVLRSRFKDARFFWDFDQKISLHNRVELLKSVTFQKELGSYWDKTQSNSATAGMLADLSLLRGAKLDKPALLQAVELAKADLTAELVKEFTELQGVVGGLYARAQGLDEVVAGAIYWQYSPASGEDPIPPTAEGQLLGLADRINTIVDMFAIDLKPTGSKDPFALRRAASGIVKILAESELPITLADVSRIAKQASAQPKAASILSGVPDFLRERLDFYLRENRNFSYDVVAAALAAGDIDVRDTIARAEALTAVRGSADFAAISAAFKRIKNILRQATEKDKTSADAGSSAVDATVLVDPAEQALYDESNRLAGIVEELRVRREYREALERIATLRPYVDHFFDRVMVMAPELELRRNRLALIASVLKGFSNIADFSEMVVS